MAMVNTDTQEVLKLVDRVAMLEDRIADLEKQVQQTTHSAVKALQSAVNKIKEQQTTIDELNNDGNLIVNYFTSFLSTLDGLNKRGLLFKNESSQKSADGDDDIRKLIDAISKPR